MGKDEEEAFTMSSILKMRVVVLVSLLLVVAGSWGLAGCGNSEPDDIGTGPGMLYFYAEW